MTKIITGSPGVGKHTIARLLAKKLGLDLIDINNIAIKAGVYTQKNRVLDVDVNELKKILANEISDDSILVGHLAPYVISKKQVEKGVVLRKNPYQLISIYKKRKYPKRKAAENLGAEILGVIYYDALKNFGPKKTFQFDTSSKKPSDIVRKIQKLFENGKIREDNVDWLELVTKKKDLRQFFPY